MDVESTGLRTALGNQNGSVMVLVLMVLMIMTVIGIVSSDTVVTENYIVRNVAIHKQNVSLLDSALMVGLQQFMQISDTDAANFDPNAGPNSSWINDINNTTPAPADPEALINTIWYETNFTRPCLDAGNSRATNTLPILTTRGEVGNNNLRYAVLGFRPYPGAPLSGTGPKWRQGTILSEYVSVNAGGNDNGFGLLRMELGVRRRW